MIELLENIGFENTIELWHLAILFILLSTSVYWEYRKQKPRIMLRIIALTLVFISLYLMYLSPYTLMKKPSKSVLLLSQNIAASEVDSLRNNSEREVLKQLSNSKFVQIPNSKPVDLNELEFEIDTAFVYGYFPQLNPKYYHTRVDLETRKGIQLDYKKSIALGDSLIFNISNLEDGSIEVSAVIGQDTIVKSIGNRGQTRLSVLPKASGYILCEIKTKAEVYHFAVKVEKAEKYVVQILSNAPDFEWKFLGDYLKDKEHSVFQKTKVSKDKFKNSFFNWNETLEVNRGVANDLKILLADALAWEELSKRDQKFFIEKLKENRGSLLLRTNPNNEIQLDLDSSKSTKIFSTGDNLLESNNYKYLQFSNIYDLSEVVKNGVFRKVSPEVIYGVLNFQDSYKLSLSGKREQYVRIWETVFTELVRKSSPIFVDKSEWSVQHQPYILHLWSQEKIKNIRIISPKKDTSNLKAKSDFIYPERQHILFYPEKVGWHFIQIEGEDMMVPFYVHAESQAGQTEFLANYNQDYLNYLNFDDSTSQQRVEKYNRKLVTFWVFILFLLAVGYLWTEDKIT